MTRVYAAALTPLSEGGDALDEEAFPPYVAFLQRGGVQGVLALGTTGEGILLRPEERMRAVELFLDGALEVIAHCGAQTTSARCWRTLRRPRMPVRRRRSTSTSSRVRVATPSRRR